MKTAAQIARDIPKATLIGEPSAEVVGITHDSRQVEDGFAFAVLRGEKVDGKQFVDDAVQKGATALVVEEQLDLEVPQILVPSVRDYLGLASAACYGNPTEELAVVGITGTNGKTTVTYITESALAACGYSPGVMGTVEYRISGYRWDADHTTPEATVVQRVAREMRDLDASHLVMETSSHGLALGRLGGTKFQVVAFTNLTQDHLDFHGTMDNYARAKLTLFTDSIADNPDATAVVNLDDPFAETILQSLEHDHINVSCDHESDADIRPVSPPKYSIAGIETVIRLPQGERKFVSPLLGRHNLSNLLVSLGICVQLELDIDKVLEDFRRGGVVPGRLEPVPNNRKVAILVDYAHTPDALVRALQALRPLTEGRLFCVFGCGGDRDPLKRPLMGEAVASGADIAVVTSDNPRTEAPQNIVEMIVPGVKKAGTARIADDDLYIASAGYVVEIDRREAINKTIRAAKAQDTVLIAGKGHEDYQIIGTHKIHFDDCEEAQAVLDALDREAHE